MITASREDTKRLLLERMRMIRENQRRAIKDALGSARNYALKYGWDPVPAKRFGEAGTVAQAIHYGHNPSMEVYNLARNALAAYINGEDESWLEKPNAGIDLSAAADVIAWEEGQSTETVLATLTEMIDVCRGFDEDYAEYKIQEEMEESNEGNEAEETGN